MQLASDSAQVTRFAALVAAAATALSLGACSSSKDESPAKPPPPAAAKAQKQGEVRGSVASVDGDTIKVAAGKATATLNISPSTRILETTVVQLTDVAAGECVRVVPAPPKGAEAPDAPLTATRVHLTLSANAGKCPEPKASAPNQPVDGTVTSVEGSTITITLTDGSGNPAQRVVAVTDATSYRKDVSATAAAIAPDKCIVAGGTEGDGGTLRATRLTVWPATNDDKCPSPAAKR